MLLPKHVLLLCVLCELPKARPSVVTFFCYLDMLPEPCVKAGFSKDLLIKCPNAYRKPISDLWARRAVVPSS